MSENNNYENFNQYSEPAQPINIDAAAGNGVNPNYVMMLDDSAEQKAKAKALGTWSIVIGIFSCCCCCSIASFVGLGLAIGGLKKDKGNGASIAGLIINIIGVIMLVFSLVNQFAHPEQYQQIMEQYQQIMEQYQTMLEETQGQMQSQTEGVPGMIGMFF